MSRLDLVVGPNGAGKSTFVRFVLASARPGVPFVNADLIAGERWPEDPEANSYEAARIATAVRSKLIAAGESFIAETVFSHPSKVDLVTEARAAAFDVHLHVLMVPAALAVARVRARVEVGEHDVPQHKIVGRYARLWSNVVAAAPLCRRVDMWDNSGVGPVQVGTMRDGIWVLGPRWPTWTPPELGALGT
ncbi:AAA family ATPase [Euzebya tangerina]|uniref:AAA family ATPase n=1 Tax=Euzebya tangerina TaxID=591198 RepID=UPI000E30BB11|nr:AAA family ATPase [Euzebya tangerina]